MKILLILLAVTLSGCVTSYEKDMMDKKVLCTQFGMSYHQFQLPEMEQPDVICQNEETGDFVYMELVSPETIK